MSRVAITRGSVRFPISRLADRITVECRQLRYRCWVRWPCAPLAPDREPASRGLSVEVVLSTLKADTSSA